MGVSPRELVHQGGERYPARTAVVSLTRKLSYRQLSDLTAGFASSLRQQGIGAGDQVAIVLPNSIAYLVCYFGVLEAGGIVVPLAPAITPAEAGWVLQNAAIGWLLVPAAAEWPADHDMIPVEARDGVEETCLWKRQVKVRAIDTDPRSDEGLLVRQFSSGSTGKPKQMFKTDANVAHCYRHVCETLGLDESDVFLGVAPFCHAYGAISFLAAIHLGAKLLVLPRFLPGPVLRMARREHPTVFLATPPMIEILGSCALKEGDQDIFESLRHCIVSTGKLSRRAWAAFHDRFGAPVRIQYGSTETMSTAIDLDDGFEENRMGYPYPGVEIGIFRDDGERCVPGETGRVGVKSPAASRGYIDDAPRTRATFSDGFVFPGDRGYMDEAGRLYLRGRSDLINIGGDKVDPVEVEMTIRENAPVSDVVVLAGCRSGVPVVRAVVEADPEKVTGEMITRICRERLSAFKVPAIVEVRKRLDRDGNGKILRSRLMPAS